MYLDICHRDIKVKRSLELFANSKTFSGNLKTQYHVVSICLRLSQFYLRKKIFQELKQHLEIIPESVKEQSTILLNVQQ